jgi:uncharacterized protein (DUF1015 family)
LRFDPARVDLGAVVCPPFDVITPAEQAAYHARDPRNIVRVELGLGPADPAAPANRYAAAAAALAQWQAEGTLAREPAPAFYLYEHEFVLGGAARRRRGLLAAVRLHDWSERIVLPHEDTRAGPKQDRLALLRATQTNVSPLWLLYDDVDGRVAAALAAQWARPPAGVAEMDEERHALRVVTDDQALRAIAGAFDGRPLFIADGHHRYETAQIYRDERRAAGVPAWFRAARERAPGFALRGPGEHPTRDPKPETAHTPGGPRDPDAGPDAGYEFALMLLMARDDPGLVVLPTHRLVRGTGRPPADVRAALGRWFDLTALPLPAGADEQVGAALEGALAQAPPARDSSGRGGQGPGGPGPVFALYERGGAWLLRPRPDSGWRSLLPADHSAAWRELDVAVLDTLAIRGVCGIRAEGESAHADATSHAPADRLAYVSSFAGAVAAVRSGEAEQAFLLNPTRVEQVCAVAAAGDRMPPKSTFFYPKPVTGLVLHPLDGTRPRP